MGDLISRRGVSAWLYNLGYTKLADTVMNEQRFPSVQPDHIAEVSKKVDVDLISRADVEQTVEDNILCYTHSDRPIDQDPDTECHKAIRTALKMLRKDLRKLQPAQRWIPRSERLPNHDEYIKNNGLFIVSDGNRSYFEWYDIYDKRRFGEPTMSGFRVDYAVTAWMPLPEPYREEGGE